MNIILTFLVIVAWVLGPLTLLIGGLHIYWAGQYPGSLEQMIDRLGGYTKVFQPFRWLGMSLLCWAYIIAYYFS
jgi:hypothetical protein